jgi:hypothetical protein
MSDARPMPKKMGYDVERVTELERAEHEFALATAEVETIRAEFRPVMDRLDAALRRSNDAFDAVIKAKQASQQP